MSEDLNCPFCGSDDTEADCDEFPIGSPNWFVECNACKSRGPRMFHKEDACDKYNSQAMQAENTTLREALKAAQEELAEAKHVEMRARVHLDEQCKRNEMLQAKLLDREKRLKLASEAAWVFEQYLNRDAAGSMEEPSHEENCTALRAVCNLDKPLKK